LSGERGFTKRPACGMVPETPDTRRYEEADQSMTPRSRPWGLLIFFLIAFFLGAYFTFAAVQGDYGLFRRAEIDAQSVELQAQLEALNARVARMENLTRRLSDGYLDLDLLDQQARDVLGLLRSDEIVIR